MGRTFKNRHDKEGMAAESFDFLDEDDMHNDFPLPEPTPQRKKRKDKRKNFHRIDRDLLKELDDWQDPEDDLMYGFRE